MIHLYDDMKFKFTKYMLLYIVRYRSILHKSNIISHIIARFYSKLNFIEREDLNFNNKNINNSNKK